MSILREIRSFFMQTDAFVELRQNPDGTQREVMVIRDFEMGGWREIERPYERVGNASGKARSW